VVAEIDLHLSLGDTAARERWARPKLSENRELNLTRSRHPMVERSLDPGRFVPNDCEMDGESGQI
jgi:DNA mismatch repair protein MutS